VTIDDVEVIAGEGITEEEIQQTVSEERAVWLTKNKTLGRIEITIDGDELVVKAVERSPIKRLRRITGYLSTEDRFNPAKQAELADRRAQV
jgi:anaerobic ribonucleoside-triphosphate reductase activating protein